jgi:glutaredoxin-like protein
MARFIDDSVAAQLLVAFENLVNPVQLVFFKQKSSTCPMCADQEELLREVSNLSNKITLQTYDLVLHGDEAMNYKIDKTPATIVVGNRAFGIRFFGLTAGFEFKALVEDIIMVSSGRTGLDPRLEIMVQTLPRVHLQVMASLTCPHCPKAVQAAHRFAFINANILADMVDLTTFPLFSQKYSVKATPQTNINEGYSFVGAYPEAGLYLEILKVINPTEYQRVVEEIQKQSGPMQTEGTSTPY